MNRITAIVDELRSWEIPAFDPGRRHEAARRAKQRSLDEAILDLYKLSSADRDLVTDMCEVGLDLFYGRAKNIAVKPASIDGIEPAYGVASDLPAERSARDGLAAYLSVFLRTWNSELGPEGELRWQVVRPSVNSPMLGLVFSTQFKNNPLPPPTQSDDRAWEEILRRVSANSLQPLSAQIYIDGLVRTVSDTDMVIIKRNERRFWTRSMAREDVEATMLQAMYLQESGVAEW